MMTKEQLTLMLRILDMVQSPDLDHAVAVYVETYHTEEWGLDFVGQVDALREVVRAQLVK